MKKTLLILFFVIFLFPQTVLAKIGVGIGTGKIQIDEQLKPGIVYNLPSLTVINTGDEASEYEAAISYHEQQAELQPLQDWFIFSPERFYLEPGQVQTVDIKLNLPVKIEPGNYFAYVEAHPAKKSQNGETSVGIAAAAKLYFTVIPGSYFEGIYYKVISYWNVYAPWPQRVATGVLVVMGFMLFKKFFNFEIGLKKPSKQKHTSEDTE